jgi:hypothetical protein
MPNNWATALEALVSIELDLLIYNNKKIWKPVPLKSQCALHDYVPRAQIKFINIFKFYARLNIESRMVSLDGP